MFFALLIDSASLVAAALVDALQTTVSAAGAGPLTTRLARGLRQGALALHRRAAPAGRPRLLAAMGILLSAFSLWVLLL
jgi:hypothetical protein